MPRTEARIKCAIWDDRDFLALPMDAKALYLTVVSQPGMTHAGVLPLPRREWVNLFPDADAADRLAMARKLVEDRRYLVIDEDTDEVLVRTYIKHDIMDGPPGTFRAAMDAVAVVRSPRLRAVLRGELLRLDVAAIKAKENKSHRTQPFDAYQATLAALGDPSGGGTPKHVGDDDYVWPTEPTEEPAEDAIEDGIPSAWSGHARSGGDHAIVHGITDAPVGVDVVVDGSFPVTTQDPKKEAATRVSARDIRIANVRAAKLVVATLPRTLGNFVTREALQSRLGDRILIDEDGDLTDAVIRSALVRWVNTSKVAPAAIEWMLDDAIKESFGASSSPRGGKAGTAEIVATGRNLASKYEAEEAEQDHAAIIQIHRGAS